MKEKEEGREGGREGGGREGGGREGGRELCLANVDS